MRRRITKDVEILHLKSCSVDMKDKNYVDSIYDTLVETFNYYNKKMQGLAAIQCELPVKAMLLRFNKDVEPEVVFNPKVLFKFGFKVSHEGCLSEGDTRYFVLRPIFTVVRYVDRDGVKYTKCFGYKKSRIFMHEYDHLNGILLQDKGRKAQ